ncbi:MAG TPA: carboxypeptidase regulatory-like domain-containing protein [Kofleriaceae bacterium]
MKKAAVAGAVALVLLLVVVITKRQCGRDDVKKATSAGSSTHAPGMKVGAASQRITDVPDWLVQTGVKPRKIAGHVVFAGKPVEGAIVRLGLDASFGVLQQLAEAKTGADGAFDFGPRPGARFNVSAEAAGRRPAQLTVAVADPKAKPDQLVLELGECRSRLYGSVLDASGGVVAKAKLRVAGLAGAESDAKGEYSVCVEPSNGPPNNFVRVEADGYGTINVVIGLVGELRYDFVLVPEAVLVGKVVTDDHRPVAGARVLAIPDPSEGPHHIASGWAMSEDDGSFRIPGLSPGHYRLFAAADGLITNAAVDAIVQAGTSTRETIIVVSASARVRGHVTMAGKPVAGATVIAFAGGSGGPGPFGPSPSVSALSQDDGSFTLSGVPIGMVGLGARPYEVLAPKQLEIKKSIDDVKIEIATLAAIHGKITRKGQPVADGLVQGPSIGEPVKTDATGAYRAEGLPPGEVQFFASSAEHKAFAIPKNVKVAAGEDKLVDVELDLAGRVKGIVVDESGKPVPGVYVRLLNDEGDMGESMANAKGEFDAGSMSGGEYRASVYPSPMAGQPFEPAAGDAFMIKVPSDGEVTGVKLAIKYETFTISGRVVDDAGGPVADVHIEAIGRGKPGIDLPSIMSSADGTFRIRNLARGSYALHAHGSDGSEGDALNIAAGAENVIIKLMRPGAIEGTLVGFSNPPVVQMLTLTTDLFIGSNPIVDGTRFWQTGVRPGKYAIEAKAGTEVAGESVEIRSGETTKVTLRSRGAGKVEGRLLEFGTKTPLAGFRCDANLSMGGQMGGPPPDPSWSSVPDDKGHFAMAAPIGMVRVFCFPQSVPGLTVAGIDVEVTAAAVPNVEVYSVRTRSSSRGNAGIRIRPLVLPLVINAIEPNSAAATQGMKLGDVVVSIDGAPVQGLLPAGAMTLIGNHKAGTTVTIGVDRAGTPTTFKLPVTASPD